MPYSTLFMCANRRDLHRSDVHAIGSAQMVETFRNAPRAFDSSPSALLLGHSVNEHARIAFYGIEGFLQRADVYGCLCHDSIP